MAIAIAIIIEQYVKTLLLLNSSSVVCTEATQQNVCKHSS